MQDKQDIMRQLLELALNFGRKHKSAQTGYLHLCHGLHDDVPHLPIPVVENLLYCLALLRSRTIENVNEAKGILEGLLHFQDRREEQSSFGNFPIYLHDFPTCKDRFNSVHAAAVIFWILTMFHQVLGQDLNSKLEDSLELLVRQTLRMYAEKPPSYVLGIKVACVALASGRLLQKVDIEGDGKALLENLRLHPDYISWYCPSAIGNMLASLKMVYPNISTSPWKPFWQHLETTWHAPTRSYAGPALRVWQHGSEPQVDLYDLFMGYLSGGLSTRALKESPAHLEAVLIPQSDDVLSAITYPHTIEGSIGKAKWMLFQNEQLAFCIVEQGKIDLNPAYVHGFHPLRILWGDQSRIHTLVCQGGTNCNTKFFTTNNSIKLQFEIDSPVDVEDREKSRDVVFYIDSHADLDFLVAGEKSSTFRTEDPISIRSKQQQFTLTFQLINGEGRFLGHRMPGNRPSQVGARGSHRYEAYDWMIFLRTLGRSDKCVIEAELQL